MKNSALGNKAFYGTLKGLLVFLICLCFALICAACIDPSKTLSEDGRPDENSPPTEYTELTLGAETEAVLYSGDNGGEGNWWYRLTITETTDVDILFNRISGNGYLEGFLYNGDDWKSYTNIVVSSDYPSRISQTLVAGTYWVRLHGSDVKATIIASDLSQSPELSDDETQVGGSRWFQATFDKEQFLHFQLTWTDNVNYNWAVRTFKPANLERMIENNENYGTADKGIYLLSTLSSQRLTAGRYYFLLDINEHLKNAVFSTVYEPTYSLILGDTSNEVSLISDGGTAWYSFTLPATTIVEISTIGSVSPALFILNEKYGALSETGKSIYNNATMLTLEAGKYYISVKNQFSSATEKVTVLVKDTTTDLANAVALVLDVPTAERVFAPNEAVWYKFSLTATTYVDIELLKADSVNVYSALYREGHLDDIIYGQGYFTGALTAGVYYVRVSNNETISASAALCAYMLSGAEEITFGAAVVHDSLDAYAAKWYKLTVAKETLVQISSVAVQPVIYSEATGSSVLNYTGFGAIAHGTYYIKLKNNGGTIVSPSITVSDVLASATELTLATPSAPVTIAARNNEWYTLRLTAQTLLSISSGNDVAMYLYRDGNYSQYISYGGNPVLVAAGLYYIRLFNEHSTNAFTASITATDLLTAPLLALNTPSDASNLTANTEKWFRFNSATAFTAYLNITGTGNKAGAQLYSAASFVNPIVSSHTRFSPVAAGSYYVRLYSSSNATSNAAVAVKDITASPELITGTQSAVFSVGGESTNFWHKFVLDAEKTLQFAVTSDSVGCSIYAANNSDTPVESPSVSRLFTLSAGTYYVSTNYYEDGAINVQITLNDIQNIPTLAFNTVESFSGSFSVPKWYKFTIETTLFAELYSWHYNTTVYLYKSDALKQSVLTFSGSRLAELSAGDYFICYISGSTDTIATTAAINAPIALGTVNLGEITAEISLSASMSKWYVLTLDRKVQAELAVIVSTGTLGAQIYSENRLNSIALASSPSSSGNYGIGTLDAGKYYVRLYSSESVSALGSIRISDIGMAQALEFNVQKQITIPTGVSNYWYKMHLNTEHSVYISTAAVGINASVGVYIYNAASLSLISYDGFKKLPAGDYYVRLRSTHTSTLNVIVTAYTLEDDAVELIADIPSGELTFAPSVGVKFFRFTLLLATTVNLQTYGDGYITAGAYSENDYDNSLLTGNSAIGTLAAGNYYVIVRNNSEVERSGGVMLTNIANVQGVAVGETTQTVSLQTLESRFYRLEITEKVLAEFSTLYSDANLYRDGAYNQPLFTINSIGTVKALDAGVYYIRLYNYSTATKSASLSISILDTLATELTPGVPSETLTLSSNGTVEHIWLKFTVAETAEFSITLASESYFFTINAALYSSDNFETAIENINGSSPPTTTQTTLTEGTYYIKISKNHTAVASGTVTVELV
ncbi:MAG: hypothetical protein LBT55_07305 [Clostridiaceae bacterium]|jgi:hypothetical protein|nr:hypothetical protein [Clostridiaceae bacterium]